MNRLEKIEKEAQKAREKIAAMQALLKDIEGKRTEQEDLQIVRQVRALKLTREDLYLFINSGELPAALAAAITGDAPEPETIYTRRGKRGKTPGGEPVPGEGAEDFETGDIETESEENEDDE